MKTGRAAYQSQQSVAQATGTQKISLTKPQAGEYRATPKGNYIMNLLPKAAFIATDSGPYGPLESDGEAVIQLMVVHKYSPTHKHAIDSILGGKSQVRTLQPVLRAKTDGRIIDVPPPRPGVYLLIPKGIVFSVVATGRLTDDLLFPVVWKEREDSFHISALGRLNLVQTTQNQT